jgi:electron transfer flavoprotein alpha subunit
MAHIYTPNHRPQFATVRYKVFSAPKKIAQPTGKLTSCQIGQQALQSRITVLGLKNKEKLRSIEDAEVLIVAGRAVKNQKELDIITKLADLLGGMTAVTRPLIESGLADARLQIGLSGRTVKPKLLIACGVSGAIQFVAGMDKAEVIIAINKDENAPIFNIAHYGIIGDIFEIIPQLIENLENLRQL